MIKRIRLWNLRIMNAIKQENAVICKMKGWDKAPIQNVWLLFTEEIGELASAIRQRKKLYASKTRKFDNVKTEMGDVFSYLFQLSHMLNIDLDEMWEEHKLKMELKTYE
jgi:NTP pyrophosphatase (non-canonical NTP hydrolase)